MNIIKSALIVCALGTISLMGVPAALARDNVSISFDAGNVAAGYKDGYWDKDHHWNRWHSTKERTSYQHDHSDQYMNHSHTQEKNNGWRD